MKVPSVFVLLLLLSACVIGRKTKSSGRDSNGGTASEDHKFFLKQIFDKYGHKGIISFEGFEHLLENLGLGRLVFEKSHTLSLHKVNGSFQEVHDKLNLHQHSHEKSLENRKHRKRRTAEGLGDAEVKVTSYTEPETTLRSKCLTPQDLLLAFGLEPHHKAAISQRVFLEICPAIIYELDQRTCYTSTGDHAIPHQQGNSELSHFSAWLYASISILVISLIGLLGVAVVPLVQKAFFQQILHFLVALAVGTMSGDALLHLLPHALLSHSSDDEHDHLVPVLRALVTFVAICIFFMMEVCLHSINGKGVKESNDDSTTQTKEGKPLKDIDDPEALVDYHTETEMNARAVKHQHGHEHGPQKADTVGSVAWMVIMGDGLHNLTDGLAIGAAFSGDIVAGFATAVAVLCHELPHELGDFAVLLQAGMSIRSAITYNIISSILSFIGMATGVWIGEYEEASLWIYAFTAGTFLYISLADLIPEMNHQTENSKSFLDISLQMGGIFTGAGLMLVIALYEDSLSSLFR